MKKKFYTFLLILTLVVILGGFSVIMFWEYRNNADNNASNDSNLNNEIPLYMDYDYFKSIHGKDAGSLYYENSYITNENVYVYHDSKGVDYAVFSVIDVLLAIGYEIEWENDYVAKLTYDGVEYCLDVEKQCIFNDESYTYFGFLVGGSSDYYMEKKQLYINIACRIRQATKDGGF